MREIVEQWWIGDLRDAVRQNLADPRVYATPLGVTAAFERIPYRYDGSGNVRTLREAIGANVGMCADHVAAVLAAWAKTDRRNPMSVCLETSVDGKSAHLRAIWRGVTLDPYADKWPGPRTCRARVDAGALLRRWGML